MLRWLSLMKHRVSKWTGRSSAAWIWHWFVAEEQKSGLGPSFSPGVCFHDGQGSSNMPSYSFSIAELLGYEVNKTIIAYKLTQPSTQADMSKYLHLIISSCRSKTVWILMMLPIVAVQDHCVHPFTNRRLIKRYKRQGWLFLSFREEAVLSTFCQILGVWNWLFMCSLHKYCSLKAKAINFSCWLKLLLRGTSFPDSSSYK